MSRGQVSWVELETNPDLALSKGQVSWAFFEASEGAKDSSDSGVGTDSGSRSASGQFVSGTDAGVGTDVGVSSIGSITFKVSSDIGFGFLRYAAAGLTYLYGGGPPRSTLGTTESARNGTDTGTGDDTSEVLFQDRSIADTDEGTGTEVSSFGGRILHLIESGSGFDAGQIVAGQVSSPPEVILEVAFDSDPTDESQVYTEVSSDTDGRQMEFSTKRGRQDELQQPQTGTLVTVLFNQDRSFDPAFTLSPYYPNVRPVRQARLRAIKDAVEYHLFVGDIEQWPQQSSGRLNRASLQANDGFDPLAQVEVEVTRPEEFPGARINAILDAAAWPTSKRNIDTGQTLLHPNTYRGTALELIRKVVADEDGYFFMAGDGNATFIERHARFKPPYTTPYLTISSRPTVGQYPLSDADYQVDKDFIKNEVTVKVEAVLDSEGGTLVDEKEFSVSDATSRTEYRPRTLIYDSSAISNDNEAQTKVEYHLDRLKDPVVRVRSVTIEPQLDTNLWAHALAREIGDRIAVVIYPVQTGTEEPVQFEGIIEYVEHRYVVGRWTTTWYLSPADMNDYWILGDSALGVLGSTTRLGF